jgi:hypothetical protein
MLILARKAGPDRYFGIQGPRVRAGGFCARAAQRPDLRRRRQRAALTI